MAPEYARQVRFDVPAKEGIVMYGTVARMKVTRENLEKLRESMDDVAGRSVDGYIATHVLVPDEWHDEVLVVVFFKDRQTYLKNANDPKMDEDYRKIRAHLEADPEWTDGDWVSHEA